MELHFMFGKKENKEKEYDNWGEKNENCIIRK